MLVSEMGVIAKIRGQVGPQWARPLVAPTDGIDVPAFHHESPQALSPFHSCVVSPKYSWLSIYPFQ